MTLRTRLAKAELRLEGLRLPAQGPSILLVIVREDGLGRFSAEGEEFAVTCRGELDELLAARGWQPERVIYAFPSVRSRPRVQARFCGGGL